MYEGLYSKRRVLVTGHTGFKGSWLCTWMLQLGAELAGFSIGVPTDPSMFQVLGLEQRMTHYQGDIRDRQSIIQVVQDFKPEMVFHLAAQSLVRRSFEQPAETFETNALGTMNLLECLRYQPTIKAAVLITSDKCYRNVEWVWGYRENDILGGEDPYSASKACAELISQAYVASYFQSGGPRVATCRAGNVIGGGDWAPDRIVPDCMRAWSASQQVNIRNPQATRPWQHVLEPLSGYLWLGAMLQRNNPHIVGEAFNFGPPATVNQTVQRLIAQMGQHWPGANWLISQETFGKRESTLLKLCCDKALDRLKWRAILPFEETIRLTVDWYRTYYQQGVDPMYEITCRQIRDYCSVAEAEGLPWTIA